VVRTAALIASCTGVRIALNHWLVGWWLVGGCRRRVWDEKNQKEILISKEQMQMLRRMQQGKFPDPNFNPYDVRRRPGSWQMSATIRVQC